MMPRSDSVIFRTGGAEIARTGALWRRRRYDPLDLEAPTFTRADGTTCATLIGPDGLRSKVPANRYRVEWMDLDKDGVFETPVLLIENTSQNLCLQSENFGTTWVNDNTTTRVAAAKTCGVTNLDLLGDTSATLVCDFRQDIAAGITARTALSMDVAQGSSVSSQIALYDVTAANYIGIGVLTWAAGLPVLTPNNGLAGTMAALGYDRLGNGVFRLYWLLTNTAAHTIRVIVCPATDPAFTVASQGTLYCGGVQVEPDFPTSYIPTTTVAVTRAADTITFPVGFGPGGLWYYVDMLEAGGLSAAGLRPIATIGTLATWRATLRGNVTRYQFVHGGAPGTVAADTLQVIALRDRMQMLGRIYPSDGSVDVGLSQNGGAVQTSARSAASPAVPGSWPGNALSLSAEGGTAALSVLRLLSLKIGRFTVDADAPTFAEAQAA
jgi:hypothetical protein